MSEQYRPLQSLVVDAAVRERLNQYPDLSVEMEGERIVVVFGEYISETGGISQTAFMQRDDSTPVGSVGLTREAAIHGFGPLFAHPIVTAEQLRQDRLRQERNE